MYCLLLPPFSPRATRSISLKVVVVLVVVVVVFILLGTHSKNSLPKYRRINQRRRILSLKPKTAFSVRVSMSRKLLKQAVKNA